MKTYIKGALVFLFAGTILLATMQPAGAAFSWYAWGAGDQTVGSLISNPPVLTLQKGQDITAAYYAANADYRYFRMDLKGAPDTGSNGYAPLYRIQVSGDGSISTFAFPFPPPSLLFASGTAGLGPVFARQTGGTLEWAIERAKLPETFSWYALTGTHIDGGLSGIFDITNTAVVTPIPSAALLLGTGLIGLVGLRRRSSRKA